MREPETVIRVENVGKRYVIRHAVDRGQTTLRDTLAAALKAVPRRLVGRQPATATREEFWALQDVSFEVRRGDVLGIIGRNGAGKSTLLKVLSRITEPTTGRIEIDGRVASLLEVGTGFHPELTGRENVYLNGTILGMRRAEIRQKFDEIVAFADVERFLDTPVKRYSSGMYMRLAFAVAAHLNPEVLIVDEVLAVGDAAFQRKCLGKIGEVARGGRTVLFVSHNMAAVSALCSVGCLMAAGRVRIFGGVPDCLAGYLQTGLPVEGSQFRRETPPSDRNSWIRFAEVASAQSGHQTMGSSFTLRIEAAFERPTRSPRIGFVLSTEAGEMLLNANNTYQPFSNPAGPVTSGTFICDCGVIPLIPGQYTVSLWLGDEHGDHDVVQDCLLFRIAEGDVWGTGRQPPRNAGKMYWQTRFSFQADGGESRAGT